MSVPDIVGAMKDVVFMADVAFTEDVMFIVEVSFMAFKHTS